MAADATVYWTGRCFNQGILMLFLLFTIISSTVALQQQLTCTGEEASLSVTDCGILGSSSDGCYYVSITYSYRPCGELCNDAIDGSTKYDSCVRYCKAYVDNHCVKTALAPDTTTSTAGPDTTSKYTTTTSQKVDSTSHSPRTSQTTDHPTERGTFQTEPTTLPTSKTPTVDKGVYAAAACGGLLALAAVIGGVLCWRRCRTNSRRRMHFLDAHYQHNGGDGQLTWLSDHHDRHSITQSNVNRTSVLSKDMNGHNACGAAASTPPSADTTNRSSVVTPAVPNVKAVECTQNKHNENYSPDNIV